MAPLLERQVQLAELEVALRDAGAGKGSLVLVTGEAGAGKTSLVRHFAAEAVTSRVLWGLCDDLLTPRPLGPLRDIAGQVGGRLERVVESDAVEELPDAVLEELDRPPLPVVLVVDDAHWADEATLDVLGFLGRRVNRLHALLVVTGRDDEVPSDHPLRMMLGSIPAASIHRIRLGSLSPGAVRSLAGTSEIGDLYRLTDGNPFYVNEMLAHPVPSGVPPTVQDAVMARVGRLDDTGRICVETASVIPTRIEPWLLEKCGVESGIDEATRFGVLDVEGDTVRFTHELVRRAVERTLTSGRREDINRRVLEVLIAHDADPARLSHHAAQANDIQAVARFAPIAARRAASLDSHREAVAYFERALDQPEPYSPEELAALHYEFAGESYLTGRHETAERALDRAIEIHTELGHRRELGVDLSLLSEVHWFLGRGSEAEEASARAITVLEPTSGGDALAWAYAQRARLAMVDRRAGDAIEWGERAIELARSEGAIEVLVHALNTVGSARWMVPPFDNSSLLESLELARTSGLNPQAGRAYANLVDGYLHHLDDDRAGFFLEEGVAFCEAHDLITAFNRLLELRSAWHLEQGRWAKAEGDARRALATGATTGTTLQTVLGWLATRRGDPGAPTTLAKAQRLADRTGDTQDLLPVGLARLEHAWLQGTIRSLSALASEVFERARQTGSPRWMGETALWLHRIGSLSRPPDEAAEPFLLQIEGNWRKAATIWAEVGRPYAEADALAEATEPEPLLRALEILDRLGATPRAAMVRKRLKEMGVTRIPRGPRGAARTSPAGLTARQTEVLELLADGLTYREIADRLYISVKTVDHHISAVRLKLGVTTRGAAVEAGRRLGIISPDDPAR